MKNKRGFVKTTLFYIVIISIIAIAFLYNDHQEAYTPTNFPLIANTSEANQVLSPISGEPVKLSIPRLNINLNIIKGTYNSKTQEWTLTNNNAQFATVTSLPNNVSGDTLIYGHNTYQIFYPTNALKVGDQLLIYTDNHHVLSYAYTSSEVVTPTNTNVFSYTGGPRVTLLTCNGWFSTYRRLMYFKLVKVLQ